ncbi:hypothetical protein VM247_004544 [Salmonella enterica]|nr:hypothetical protein [Salmonella enterica]EMC8988201.1 hypothetical protein [Salmonella enterica]
MAFVLAAILLALGVWFGRRLGPAIVAAMFVLVVPLQLLWAVLVDLARLLHLEQLWFAFCKGVGLLIGWTICPFVFAFCFVRELFRSPPPPRPAQAAAQRTAQVIDLASFRQRRKNTKE